MFRKTDVIIIGGGQAGLATSKFLVEAGVDHLVLERGEVAQRWTAERWNSLRLLTPNWMTRLPGFSYTGSDPDGFMDRAGVAQFLNDFRANFSAPVLTHTQVFSVERADGMFRVATNKGTWIARSVVIATGACDVPNTPKFANRLSPAIRQITLDKYKCPADVEPGGVLVVGAAASGLQIANELLNAGHDVTIAAGRHTRVPRQYRGRDIMYWLDRSGILTDERDPAIDVEALARHPSFQLVGTNSGVSLNLQTVSEKGARIIGRLKDADDEKVLVQNNLSDDIFTAELRLTKLLSRLDAFIDTRHGDAPQSETIPTLSAYRPGPQGEMDLWNEGINTVVWATGYRRNYSWLNIPVLTSGGEIIQQGGVTPVPGLFTMGLPFMRRRNSSFIDGVGADASDISTFILTHLNQTQSKAA